MNDLISIIIMGDCDNTINSCELQKQWFQSHKICASYKCYNVHNIFLVFNNNKSITNSKYNDICMYGIFDLN